MNMTLTMQTEYLNPPITVDEVASFARSRNISLPKSYLSFLKHFNGGRPTKPNFPLLKFPGADNWNVGTFFGIGTTHPSNELAYNFDLYQGGFPGGIVPIASDDGGINYVCLDTRSKPDAVAFWDKRHFWGTGEWRESDLYHIADSFDAFLKSLKPSPY